MVSGAGEQFFFNGKSWERRVPLSRRSRAKADARHAMTLFLRFGRRGATDDSDVHGLGRGSPFPICAHLCDLWFFNAHFRKGSSSAAFLGPLIFADGR